MTAPYVALATATRMAKQDFDEAPLLAALAAIGVPARVLAWDDPAAQAAFHGAAACLIRSTWNYVHHHDGFCAWADRVGAATLLSNPAPVVRWNSHKRYLQELEARNIPIVPTRLVPRGASADLTELLGDWSAAVIKPAISAGSFGTVRVQADEPEAGQAHLTRFLADRDMLVQRYEPSVEGYGERALVWLDGAFTHGVRKHARFSGDQESVSPDAQPIAPDERALAERILEVVAGMIPHPLLYARVDLVRDAEGQPRLMELELIEPSLFFSRQPGSAQRLAAALARAARLDR